MTDEKKPSSDVTPQTPTQRDFEVLQVVHRQTDRLVLAPIQFNGEPRFALALLFQDETGKPYTRVLAVLTQPEDVLLDMRGNSGYNKVPAVKKDLN